MLQRSPRGEFDPRSWRQAVEHGSLALVATILAGAIVASECTSSAVAPSGLACLPPNIKATDIVSATLVQIEPPIVQKVTVAQKLTALNADCKNGTLVDGSGNQIYFYMLTGCWGNPPSNYQEILQQQEAELARLRQQYTVIEMTCNPSGLPLS